MTEEPKEIYSESMFVDSGAHSIYNIHVLKHGKREGAHGRVLDKPPVKWSQGDFSYFDLTKGSPFRKYCDDYATFMKSMVKRDAGVLMANIDAISNPDLTWEIQRFFEEEHGVQPMPIIHCYTPMKYVDRYLEAGRYDLLGVGGLGQGISRHEYFKWGDELFLHICPESKGYMPQIRTHGFAMTSWELICRWPWWSVDSATWVKLSAYGWLYIPRYLKGKFSYDHPPMTINFSFRSPQKKIPGKHYDNVKPAIKKACDLWIKKLGLDMGTVDDEGKTLEFGLASHHRARSIANLTYLTELQNSRPDWPHTLDPEIVSATAVGYGKGFGL